MGIKGIGRLRRQVRGMRDDLGDEVSDAVDDASETVAGTMRSNVLTGGQVWTGNLASSIYVRQTEGEGIHRVRIVADAPYAAYVEFGTGPRGAADAPSRFQFQAPTHTPELTRQIQSWVETKPTFMSGFFDIPEESLGYVIARSISEKGTHPHPFARPAWFSGKPVVMNSAERAVKRVIRRS